MQSNWSMQEKRRSFFLPITFDGQVEGRRGSRFEQLGKDGATGVHRPIVAGNHAQSAENHQTKLKSCTLTSEQKTLWKSSYAEPNATDSPDNSDPPRRIAELAGLRVGGFNF